MRPIIQHAQPDLLPVVLVMLARVVGSTGSGGYVWVQSGTSSDASDTSNGATSISTSDAVGGTGAVSITTGVARSYDSCPVSMRSGDGMSGSAGDVTIAAGLKSASKGAAKSPFVGATVGNDICGGDVTFTLFCVYIEIKHDFPPCETFVSITSPLLVWYQLHDIFLMAILFILIQFTTPIFVQNSHPYISIIISSTSTLSPTISSKTPHIQQSSYFVYI